jgi:hypothetical protein
MLVVAMKGNIMSSKVKLTNANGNLAEIVLENPDTNLSDARTIDVSKIVEENTISGTFTTTDGKTITITNGVVTGIEV